MTIYKYIIVETKGQDLLLETIYIPKTSIYQLVWYLKALLRLLLYLYTPKTHLQYWTHELLCKYLVQFQGFWAGLLLDLLNGRR